MMLNRIVQSLIQGWLIVALALVACTPVVAENERPTALELTKQERQWIQDNPVIRVQNDPGFVPFDYQEQGQPRGYSIEFISLLAAELGLQVEFVNLPWSGMFAGSSNHVDVITSVAYTQERGKYYHFTEPYFQSSLSIVKHKRAQWLREFNDLDGALIALTDGSARIQLLNEHLKEVNLLPLNSVTYALQAVNNDRADASLVDSNVANYLIPSLRLDNVETVELKQYFGDRYQQFRFAVPRDNLQLVTLLNKAINAFPESKRQELEQRWLNQTPLTLELDQQRLPESSNSSSLATVLLLVLVCVLLIFIAWVARSNNNYPIEVQLSRLSRWAAATAVAFVLALLGISEWGLQQLRTSIIEDQELFLKTSLFSAQQSIDRWADEVLQEMGQFASQPKVKAVIQDLSLANTDENQRSMQAKLATINDNVRRISRMLDLAVLDSDGVVITSSLPDIVGKIHQIKTDKPHIFKRLSDGESLMLHSLKAPVPSMRSLSWRAALYFAIPVDVADSGKRYFLVAMVDPAGRFSELLTTIHPSASGETYAFNGDGLVISQLRHVKDLESAGLLRPNDKPILRISLRDPGRELDAGDRLYSGKIEQLPLTKMAASAIKGEMSWDLEGYRDYRGVKVVGAWLWDETHGLGIATEIDYAEAMRTYQSARVLANLETGLIIVAALLIAFIGYRATRRITKVLQDHNDHLAVKVEERTEELKSERQRLQVMIDNVPAVLFMKDLQGRFVMVNNFLEKSIALSRDEIIGRTNEELFSKYTAARVSMIEERIIKTKLPQQFESDAERLFTGELADEQHVVSYVPVLDGNGKATAIVGLYLDITDRKRLEQNLIEARDIAEKANRAKSDFLATMSHEIRTPLNGVLGMLNLVLKTPLSPPQYHQVETAFASARTLLSLINDILDFSKIEAGRFELDNVDFKPSVIIDEVCNTLRARADEKKLELILDLADLPSIMVSGDPVRLRQILLNLVSNAIKFTDKGEIVIKAWVSALAQGGYRFNCSVSDSGIGIAQEQLPLLFSAFTQLDSGTSREFEGSGLGLAITRRLCHLMDGDVDVKSTLGQGSTFTFNIHLQHSDVAYGGPRLFDISHAQVLVVDDNHVNREVLKRQLEGWGTTVTEIANSLDVLPYCLQESAPQFDVILVDMNMPNLDGLSLVRMIRNHASLARTKVLLLPSSSYLGSKEELLELGIDGCLGKPVMPDELHLALSILVHEGDQLRPQNKIVTEAFLKAYSSSEANIRPVEQTAKDWGVGKRLLLVDDNITNQLVGQGFVEALQIECTIANNGLEALELLRQSPIDRPYDLVLMDCQMPIMNGYEATKEIRRGAAGERYHRVPIIAMTAHAMAADRDKCLQSGMDDYLTKPMDFERCTEVLHDWLVGKNQPGNHVKVSVTDDATKQPDPNLKRLQIPEGLTTIDFERAPPAVAELPQVYLKSLQAYQRQYQQIDVELTSQLTSEEHQDKLIDIAHTLKGSSANLGMTTVANLADKIESDGRNGQAAQAKEIDELINRVLLSVEDARLIIDANKAGKLGTQTEHSESYLMICEQLMTQLQHDEVIEAELLERFNQTAVSKLDKAVIEAIESFEYGTAISLLQRILATD